MKKKHTKLLKAFIKEYGFPPEKGNIRLDKISEWRRLKKAGSIQAYKDKRYK